MEIEKMMCVLEGGCPTCVYETGPFSIDMDLIHVGGTVAELGNAYRTIQDCLAVWTSGCIDWTNDVAWHLVKRQFERLRQIDGPGGRMVIGAPCDSVDVWCDHPDGVGSVMLIIYCCPKCGRTYECYKNHVGDWDVVEGKRMEDSS